jgi:hypothetical protein
MSTQDDTGHKLASGRVFPQLAAALEPELAAAVEALVRPD